MKKNKNNLMIFILFLTFIFIGIELSYSQSLQWKIENIRQKGKDWVFSYSYPVLNVPGALMGVRGIINDFKQKIICDIENEKKDFLKKISDSKKMNFTNEHKVSCTQIGKDKNYASFIFDHFEMINGWAHPNNWYSSVNWISDGRFIQLRDIFRSENEGLELLSKETEKLLKIKYKKNFDKIYKNGYSPELKNFKNFCISSKGIHIYFDVYQLGQRPLGACDIIISWSSIKSGLSDDFRRIINY